MKKKFNEKNSSDLRKEKYDEKKWKKQLEFNQFKNEILRPRKIDCKN